MRSISILFALVVFGDKVVFADEPEPLTPEIFESISTDLKGLAESTSTGDLDRLREVTERITRLEVPSPDNVSEEAEQQRRDKLRLLLRGFAVADGRIDPKFDPEKDPPSRNVAVAGVLSGVDPKSVIDPVAREKYQKAVDDNRRKQQYHSLQIGCQKLRKHFLKDHTFRIARWYYPVDDKEAEEKMDSLLREEYKDDEFRESFASELKALDKRFGVQSDGLLVAKPN